jgi:flagellar biosynthesis repressor protein FlbT
MPGLVIKLFPHERIYINGAVIENGDRKSELCLPQPDTDLLRERDILYPEASDDILAAACALAQEGLMRRAAREAVIQQLCAQLRALLHDPAYRDDDRILSAARRLSEGSLSGAHYQLLRAHRERTERGAHFCEGRPVSQRFDPRAEGGAS